jgi:hypothetical protein
VEKKKKNEDLFEKLDWFIFGFGLLRKKLRRFQNVLPLLYFYDSVTNLSDIIYNIRLPRR